MHLLASALIGFTSMYEKRLYSLGLHRQIMHTVLNTRRSFLETMLNFEKRLYCPYELVGVQVTLGLRFWQSSQLQKIWLLNSSAHTEWMVHSCIGGKYHSIMSGSGHSKFSNYTVSKTNDVGKLASNNCIWVIFLAASFTLVGMPWAESSSSLFTLMNSSA